MALPRSKKFPALPLTRDGVSFKDLQRLCGLKLIPKSLVEKEWEKRKLTAEKFRNINLDLGCGSNVQPGYTGMDRRDVKGVSIVHNIEDLPWPLENESCYLILASHILEHLTPGISIDIMNEAWRVLKPEGQLIISVPYWTSIGFGQDPTHIGSGFNENTFTYYDPASPLYRIYYPKPWRIFRSTWHPNGNLEVILNKRRIGERVKLKWLGGQVVRTKETKRGAVLENVK